MIESVRLATLARVLSRDVPMADLLPSLHQYAVETAGGRCSVLFQASARTALLHPTSAFGLDDLPTEAWFANGTAGQAARDALRTNQPVVMTDLPQRLAHLASCLDTRHAVLLPLAGVDEPLGLLVLGVDVEPAAPGLGARLAPVADAFVLALERLRLRREAALQRDVRALMHDFSRRLAASLHLRAGLEIFCDGASRLFGADRVSVWLHDRRARVLRLEASSDPATLAAAAAVAVDDRDHPAAAAMRREGGLMHDAAAAAGRGTIDVGVGLRGRRRAIGTLLFEGMRVEPGGDADALARAEEVARHLAAAIENAQLFEQVLQSRRELENTFNALSDLVAVCDAELRLVHVNRAFAERAGVPPHVLIRRPLGEVAGPAITGWLASLTGDPDAWRGPQARQLADPVLGGTFALTASPLPDGDGDAGVVLVARDVSGQAQLAAEQLALRDRLAQSEKLAALGQFVAGVAHELNNPLQGVLGHLELLRTTGDLPAPLRRDVQTISREAERAAKIVRNLLVFTGSRTLARRRLSVNLVAARVLRLRGAPCRAARIEVVHAFDAALPRLVGDPAMLQQALLNVVLNAEQAVCGLPDARIEVGTRFDAARRRVVISIADNGAGLPPEVLSRVFEPFFTTREVGQGTGLGLALAYGIVQEHGGFIAAANGPERGAVFTIDLPVDSVE